MHFFFFLSFPLEEPLNPPGSPKNDLGPPGPKCIVGGSVPECLQCIYEGVKGCVCVCVYVQPHKEQPPSMARL